MALCKNCGARIADEATVCPSCGAPVTSTAEDFFDKVKDLNNTADTTYAYHPQDVQSNRVMAVLAYLSWLVLVPIFGAKDSPYARFHANQGLVLVIVEAVWGIFAAIAGELLWFLGFVLDLGSIVFAVLTIIGIVNAAKGRAKELPVIGRFRILK